MAEDQQEATGLLVYREGDRFASLGRHGRARVWEVDLVGEPIDTTTARHSTGPNVVVAPSTGRRADDTLPTAVDREQLAERLRVLAGMLTVPQEETGLPASEITGAARWVAAQCRALAIEVTTSDCPASDHRPVQHRDGRPPWCHACERTADGVPYRDVQQWRGRNPRG